MVRSLRRQHVAARRQHAAARRQTAAAHGPPRGAGAGLRPRKAQAGQTRARRHRVDRRRVRPARIGAGSGGEAPFALIALQPAVAGRKARGARPAVRRWRLPRSAVIGALAVAVSAAAVDRKSVV